MEVSRQYDELHELIHSLDQRERRHFSLYAKGNAQGEEYNYDLLFQIFSKMPEYDPEYLRIEMEKCGIATPVPAAKNHLKTMLFKAMRDYKPYQTTYSALLEGLENLAFLYRKQLYGMLKKEIKRLKKIATQYAEHQILLKIGDYERRLHKTTAQQDLLGGLDTIRIEMDDVQAEAQNQRELGYLKDKMMLIAKKRSPDWAQEMQTVLSHPLLTSIDNAQSTFAKVYFHQIMALAHTLQGEYHLAKMQWGSVLFLLEDEPHLIEEHTTLYQRNLCNYLGTYRGDADPETIEEALERIRSNPSQQVPDKAETFILSASLELGYKMSTHDWEAIETLMPSLETGLQTYGPYIEKGHLLTFQFHIALYYFLQEDYAACKKWLRAITESQRTERCMDNQRLARVLQLLLTWLGEDYDLLEHQHRSVKRYFERNGSNALEMFVLELIQVLLHSDDPLSQKAALEHFQKQLSSPEAKGLQGAMALKAWAIAKANTQPTSAIIKELETMGGGL